MKAVVFDKEASGQSQLRLVTDYPLPCPSSGEVRVRTTLAGICHTDLEVIQGYAAFQGVLGHEFVGVVDESPVPGWVGRRVVGEINIGCGGCDLCLAGYPAHCRRRTVLGIRGRDGVLAEAFCLPVANLHLVPDAVPDEVAVFTEPLAAACEILMQVHVRPADRVVVLGDGKLGNLVAQVLALTGCNLTVVGRHPHKLATLAARGIRTHVGTEGLEGQADLVVECTGRPEGFQTARRLVRPRGMLVLKSTFHGTIQVDLSDLVVDEVQIVGSRCGPFPAALRLLEQNLVQVTSLIEAIYPLDEALAAFEHARRSTALKVLVRVGS